MFTRVEAISAAYAARCCRILDAFADAAFLPFRQMPRRASLI